MLRRLGISHTPTIHTHHPSPDTLYSGSSEYVHFHSLFFHPLPTTTTTTTTFISSSSSPPSQTSPPPPPPAHSSDRQGHSLHRVSVST
ncbi:hypothetical protein E2C01_067692 [Portunus trituberculatus]|uniref:Uncharacterized protein n=1 Tax=Portunus trituberculatus TaxID=210409 RepID=A0A5B7HUA9_PORTR|nr:hypothetical protein [Portunus trituberculatus]